MFFLIEIHLTKFSEKLFYNILIVSILLFLKDGKFIHYQIYFNFLLKNSVF